MSKCTRPEAVGHSWVWILHISKHRGMLLQNKFLDILVSTESSNEGRANHACLLVEKGVESCCLWCMPGIPELRRISMGSKPAWDMDWVTGQLGYRVGPYLKRPCRIDLYHYLFMCVCAILLEGEGTVISVISNNRKTTWLRDKVTGKILLPFVILLNFCFYFLIMGFVDMSVGTQGGQKGHWIPWNWSGGWL